MKKLTLLAFALFFAAAAQAAVPQLINFQGQLTDADGKPVTTTKPVQFQLYNSETSNNLPNLLHDETQNVTPDSEGNYAVFIGSTSNLNNAIFNQDLWLQVTVAGERLSPRYRLASVPYAIRASTANFAASVNWSAITGIPSGFADGDDAGSGSVSAASITAGTLNSNVIASSVANNAIGTAQIVDGSITNIKLAGLLSGTNTLSFTQLAANTCEDLTISVTGARSQDTVALGLPSSMGLNPGSMFTAFISNDDTVTVRHCNPTAAQLGAAPPSGLVRADVWHH